MSSKAIRNNTVIAIIFLLTSHACYPSFSFGMLPVEKDDFILGQENPKSSNLVIGRACDNKDKNCRSVKGTIFGSHNAPLDCNFLGSIFYHRWNQWKRSGENRGIDETKLFITTSQDGKTKVWSMLNKPGASFEKIKKSLSLVQTLFCKRPSKFSSVYCHWQERDDANKNNQKFNNGEYIPDLSLVFTTPEGSVEQTFDIESGECTKEEETKIPSYEKLVHYHKKSND